MKCLRVNAMMSLVYLKLFNKNKNQGKTLCNNINIYVYMKKMCKLFNNCWRTVKSRWWVFTALLLFLFCMFPFIIKKSLKKGLWDTGSFMLLRTLCQHFFLSFLPRRWYHHPPSFQVRSLRVFLDSSSFFSFFIQQVPHFSNYVF